MTQFHETILCKGPINSSLFLWTLSWQALQKSFFLQCQIFHFIIVDVYRVELTVLFGGLSKVWNVPIFVSVCCCSWLLSFWLAPLGRSTGSGGDQSAVSHWQVFKYEVRFLLMKYSIHTSLSQNQWLSLCVLPGYQSPCQWVIPVSLFSLLVTVDFVLKQ